MEEFDLKELWDLWHQGKTINDAIDAFVDRAAIKKQVKKTSKDQGAITQISDTTLLGERQKQQKKASEFSEYEKEIFQNLYEKIQSGHLLAIGYMEPVGGSDVPDLIPSNFGPPQAFSLEHSSVTFQEARFSHVRIAENPKHNSEIVDKPVGRPSRKQEIISAYIALRDVGDIDYSKTFKSHTELIRKTVRRRNPKLKHDKGLGEEAIRLAVKPLFDQDKRDRDST